MKKQTNSDERNTRRILHTLDCIAPSAGFNSAHGAAKVAKILVHLKMQTMGDTQTCPKPEQSDMEMYVYMLTVKQ